jgi:hypothetical protein
MNAKGVTVHLTAIDPNNNFQDIGYVTTDIYGNYATLWTPPVPGLYVVTATFEGSNSYYGSSAETAFGVEEATCGIRSSNSFCNTGARTGYSNTGTSTDSISGAFARSSTHQRSGFNNHVHSNRRSSSCPRDCCSSTCPLDDVKIRNLPSLSFLSYGKHRRSWAEWALGSCTVCSLWVSSLLKFRAPANPTLQLKWCVPCF